MNFFTQWIQRRKQAKLTDRLARLSEIRALKMLHKDALLGSQPWNRMDQSRVRQLYREEVKLKQDIDRLRSQIIEPEVKRPSFFNGCRILTGR